MCITPLTLKRTYATIQGGTTDVVPCGKCFQCLRTRANAWAFRLKKQMDVSESAHFITLTYSDEPQTPNGHGTLRPSDFTLFMKRLRRYVHYHFPNHPKIKYYMCGEYGSKYLRPHYHAIMYNIPHEMALDIYTFQTQIWSHGQVDIAACNMATINYVCGYVMKGSFTREEGEAVDQETGEIVQWDDRVPEYSRMSKNLGLNYLTEKVWDWHVSNMIGFVKMDNGALMNMPRYYKQKVFSKEERKELQQEAQYIRNMSLDDYLEYDYNMEIARKKNQIRRYEKEQLLKRLKL